MKESATNKTEEKHSCTTPFVSLLIADDYEVTRSALVHLVTMRIPTAAVHVTDDYSACLEICSRQNIDILISNLKRASLRIPDTFERILSDYSDIQLILTTGSSDRGDLAVFSGRPNVAILEKPVEFPELLAAIQTAVSVR